MEYPHESTQTDNSEIVSLMTDDRTRKNVKDQVYSLVNNKIISCQRPRRRGSLAAGVLSQ